MGKTRYFLSPDMKGSLFSVEQFVSRNVKWLRLPHYLVKCQIPGLAIQIIMYLSSAGKMHVKFHVNRTIWYTTFGL